MINTINLIRNVGPLLILYALALPSFAAPITYGFEATITNVPRGVPFELPLSFSVGDTVSGRFTVEPQTGSSNEVRREYSQPGKLLVVVDGVELSSTGFAIKVHNNEGFIDAPFDLVDLIEVGCSRPGLSTACNPEIIDLGEGEPFRFRPLMSVFGSEDVLSDTSIPTYPSVWNDLDIVRLLHINFDNVGPGSIGFDAHVGSLWIVPEPTSLTIFFSAFIATLMISPRKRL